MKFTYTLVSMLIAYYTMNRGQYVCQPAKIYKYPVFSHNTGGTSIFKQTSII